jgi:translocation and assembly module TamB
MSRRAKLLWWGVAGIAAVCLVAVIVGIFVARSLWFHEKVRDRIVTEVERATGGRVEIGSFRFDWRTLTAEVAPFVLHGTEPADSRPLFRADSVVVGLKIVSMIERNIDIQSLHVEKPELVITVHPDGSTNFPSLQFRGKTGTLSRKC